MNLMTRKIWETLITSVPPHPGFKFQPIEADGYIGLRVFLDNFAEFSEPQRQDLAIWLESLCQNIRDSGTPCYLEAVETDTTVYKNREKRA